MRKKLTSRKLWLAIIGFVSALGVIFGVEDIRMEQICALIGALGTLVAYIFDEGVADATASKTDTSAAETQKSSNETDQNKEKS